MIWFLVRGRVRIKIWIRVRVGVGFTYNISVITGAIVAGGNVERLCIFSKDHYQAIRFCIPDTSFFHVHSALFELSDADVKELCLGLHSKQHVFLMASVEEIHYSIIKVQAHLEEHRLSKQCSCLLSFQHMTCVCLALLHYVMLPAASSFISLTYGMR